MSAIEVVVRPRPETAPSTALAPLHGLFDVIVDGVNITARLGEGQALAVLSDLGHAVSALSRGKRDRITLPLYAEDQPWELGLEADGTEVLVSVYRVGPQPEVAVHERRVDLVLLRAAITRAIDETNLRDATAGTAAALSRARHLLDSPWPSYGRRPIERRRATIAPVLQEAWSFRRRPLFAVRALKTRPVARLIWNAPIYTRCSCAEAWPPPPAVAVCASKASIRS